MIHFEIRKHLSGEKIRLPFYALIHPIDALETLKYKKLHSIPINAVLLFLWVTSELIVRKNTNFVFTNVNPDRINIGDVIIGTAAIFFLLTIANLLLCTFMEGEGKYIDIFCAASYALIPLIIRNLLTVALTALMPIEMMPFFQLFNTIFYIWTAWYIIGSFMGVHQFGLGKTLLNLCFTIVMFVLMVGLLFLLYSLLQQIASFIYTLYHEIMFRR